MPRARCGRPPVARVARWVDEGRRFGWRPEVGAPVAQDGPDGAPGPVAELAREEELEPRVGPSKEAFEGRDDCAILGPPGVLGGIVAHAEDVVEGRRAREAVGAVGGEAEPFEDALEGPSRLGGEIFQRLQPEELLGDAREPVRELLRVERLAHVGLELGRKRVIRRRPNASVSRVLKNASTLRERSEG